MEDVQTELSAFYSEIANVARTYPDELPWGFAKRAAEAEQLIWNLSQEDIDLLSKLLSGSNDWQQVPKFMASVLEVKRSPQLEALPQFEALASPPTCPWSPGWVGLMATKAAVIAFEFAIIFAPDDMVVVVLGEGGTISAHPIKVALQLGFEFAQSAVLTAETQVTIRDECETNAHQELLRQLDDALNQHDQDIKKTLSQHDQDIKNRLDKIEQKLDATDPKLNKILEFLITRPGNREGFPFKK